MFNCAFVYMYVYMYVEMCDYVLESEYIQLKVCAGVFMYAIDRMTMRVKLS